MAHQTPCNAKLAFLHPTRLLHNCTPELVNIIGEKFHRLIRFSIGGLSISGFFWDGAQVDTCAIVLILEACITSKGE